MHRFINGRVVVLGVVLGLLVPSIANAATSPAPTYGTFTGTVGSIAKGTSPVVLGSQCDDCVVQVPLPFNFTYMGHLYLAGTMLHVSSNGALSFDTNFATNDYSHVCPLPDTASSVQHGAALFPLWQDLDSSVAPGEGIFTATTGSAPNRRFVIEWRTQRHTGGSPNETDFSVQLLESNGEVEFDYGSVGGGGANAAIGIQQDSTAGATYQSSCNSGGTPVTPKKYFAFSPSSPSINGPAEQAQVLTASNPSYTGSPAPTLTIQWLRCASSGAPDTCVDIPGATGPSYTVALADVGHTMGLRSTATNSAGSAATYSAVTEVVLAAPLPAPVYTATHAMGASIVPGTSDIGLHADDDFSVVTLPFAVDFYGQQHTFGTVTSNGSLIFGSSTNASNTSSCLPNDVGRDSLQAYQMDLRTDSPGNGIFSGVSGTAPHRTYVLEWRAVYYTDTTKGANFEIVVHEDSPIVSVIYGASADSGVLAVAGIQHGLVSPFTSFSCKSASLVPGSVVNYVPSQPVITGAAVQGVTLGSTAASFTGRTVPVVTLQWERCDAQGVSCVSIPGATGAGYVSGALDVGHTLRVRDTATNSDGSGSIESQPSAVVAAPTAVLSKLKLSPDKFPAASHGGSVAVKKKVKPTGTKLSFKLNVAANVKFTALRVLDGRSVKHKCVAPSKSNKHKPHCSILKAIGSFTVSGAAGANSLHFTGRIGGHALAHGSYELVARPTGANNKPGKPVSASFTITK